VKRALAALRKVTPNVIGAVLNAVDVKTKGYYGYAYYGSRKERGEKAEARRGAAATRPRLAGEARGEVGDASTV
jgi:Mrp family chromosome partitioning ATPase